ncbi:MULTISPECIES: ACT domain-containing protein [Streptomyces]|uniref:ACT domain-containing protein n=1 Tax=Streptomyces TaxID=1883 RepID=UPI00099FA43F|nr:MULTISPECIES: ACT domain-containing protein [Streptomyces]
MGTGKRQRLRVLSSRLTVELLPEEAVASALTRAWWALVRGPEGLTVIHEVPDTPDATGAVELWAGLYGENAHELDVPGMLVALLEPLGRAGVPVFVASTFDSDVVLVPVARFEDAERALKAAGHEVVGGH